MIEMSEGRDLRAGLGIPLSRAIVAMSSRTTASRERDSGSAERDGIMYALCWAFFIEIFFLRRPRGRPHLSNGFLPLWIAFLPFPFSSEPSLLALVEDAFVFLNYW